jgi:NADH:ubiquinone oxidoreductase subunit E
MGAPAPVPGVEARAGRFPGPSLIPELQAIQSRLGWLPRAELVALSRRMRRPLYEIEGLVSFYPHFRTEAPPKVALHVRRDLSCWLAGSAPGLTDGYGPDVEVREVSCLGRCDTAPAIAVNEYPARAADADALVAAARMLIESGLRGMGGAGFPTGKKWDLVAAQPGRVKYAICNADESEPGTFKDRQIIADQPYLVLEGLLVGMLCVGAEHGWVFIRHEYGPEERVLRAEITALRAAGLLGGASSNFLRPDQLDVPLDFATLAAAVSILGSGALVAIAEGTDLLAAATNVLRFFRDESCGKCVPCRVGSTKAHALLSAALAGGGLDEVGAAQLTELEYAMRKTSICGLGQVALGPVMSVLTLRAADPTS